MSQVQKQETSSNQEICGAETSRGGTCQNVKESCPWHNENGERTDNSPGRNSKYNEERVKDMIEAAETGLPMNGIARAGGIGLTTLYEWLEDKPEFSKRLKSARSKAERKLAKEAQKKDPRYILTRSFKWDKPSADTVINNQMMQSQKQESNVMERMQEAAKQLEQEREGESDAE